MTYDSISAENHLMLTLSMYLAYNRLGWKVTSRKTCVGVGRSTDQAHLLTNYTRQSESIRRSSNAIKSCMFKECFNKFVGCSHCV